MTELIKPIISTLIVVFSLISLRMINLNKEQRNRQVIIIFITPLVLMIEMLLAYFLFDKVVFFNRCSNTDNPILALPLIIIWNTALIIVYLFIKALLCIFLKLGKFNFAFAKVLSSRWYDYDESHNAWFLKKQYQNIRSLFHVISWAVAFISIAILTVFWQIDDQLNAFPIVALITIIEIYNFLSGYTKLEYFHTIEGDNIASSKVSAYCKLRKIYESLFPSALLVSHTGNEYPGKEGITEIISKYQESNDPVEQNVGNYFVHLNNKEKSLDVDMITAVNKLLHKESMVIFNPFYRDIGTYILLPLINSLINNKKCLIIVGRHSLCDDVIHWVNQILQDYSRTKELWRVSNLSRDEKDMEVGVLSFSQLYDVDVINTNTAFFLKTDFVMLIEPSKMMSTSQSGLSIIVDKMKNKPNYCICDRDMDGLVDTLSHVLQVNLTNVIAAPIPRCVYTAMGWAASGDFMRQKLFDKQTHYLGNGIEIAAVALKNQIPHVTWYSAEKAPVLDIRWIAGQYYPQICRYSHIQNQQKSFNDKITFSANLWGSKVKNKEFVIVEDEFCNMFATMRAYLTRGEAQSFVNVISENYLLRDYMRYNRQLFMSDPKAVPGLAPHYAKTERNTIIRLILMMACSPVPEHYISHELSVLGYENDDIYTSLSRLIEYYTLVSDMIITAKNKQLLDDELIPISVCHYSISSQVFEANFSDTLKNAYFVVEDEKFNSEYIDARLFEHITQIVMPGQFITYNGKYYRVHMVSPSIGCVLHRAADFYNGRYYYKQLRNYNFGKNSETVNQRKVMDIEITTERRSFSVSSSGYLEMKDNHDLRSARLIDLSKDPCIKNYQRYYKNKNVLRIELPKSSVQLRFTICLLLHEMLRTIFPDSWPYIAVLSSNPENVEGILNKFVYHIDGEYNEDMIYIVEDSDMDLGLLEAIDNNLLRLFEIMLDFLEWHFDKMKEPPVQDPVLSDIEIPNTVEIKRQTFFSKVAKNIMRLFSASVEKENVLKDDVNKDNADTKEVEINSENNDKGETNGIQEIEESPFTEEIEEIKDSDQIIEPLSKEDSTLDDEFEIKNENHMNSSKDSVCLTDQNASIEIIANEKKDKNMKEADVDEKIILHTEGEELFAVDGLSDDLDLLMPIESSRYQKECFIKFGFDEIDSRLLIEDVKSYLMARGYGNSALTKARKRTEMETDYLDLNAENFCDFCGMPLTGVSYERLSDGRIRCNDCSLSAINDVHEFKELFKRTEMMMENTYSITVPVSITIKTTDAHTIARHAGQVFTPSEKVAERVLGFARYKGGKYCMFIENGSPRLAAIITIVHELTHIWQYLHWDDKKILSIYWQNDMRLTKKARDILYEGMAMWASIQILYTMQESYCAQQQELAAINRKDIYGIGYRLYRERFGMDKSGNAPLLSPFMSFPPLDPKEVAHAIEGSDNR